jgi:hypothetical protein
MAAWTELTASVVSNALPTDMGTLYASWIDANPAKANRLTELVGETRELFRQAVAGNPQCEVDADPNTVPTTGFRHALNTVIFNLGMEMGVQFAPEVYTLVTRADIWLRMVQNGGINPANTTAGANSPSYRVPDECFTHNSQGAHRPWSLRRYCRFCLDL